MSQSIGNTALAYARAWHHVDASERVLGKLAERIAIVLMGKHKPIYDKSCTSKVFTVDCGDYVVVTNVKDIQVTGRKDEEIVYRRHTRFPGGLKERPYKEVMETKPSDVLYHAVSGMLPKNRLKDRRLARLKVFGGSNPGIYKANIMKRWEDGTLTEDYIKRLDPKNRPQQPEQPQQ
ncbi:60S ribosomal protein L23 [Coniophora puteana RWD-64-598 SS2]|uniref:60S ribosomal protein L23 n=1 Tax=Coniophora puteana (strain RWD-64-598) TaxID=741705 RepID=A0A5M3MB85_CONPW|nr:60S ribosomal protein L23 [Coniophora puteana RWD-64-598 SS2]EIW76266.1 60S ribosomal protein L23 [Coniophora puteana RWD-64-598 SS2]